MKYEDIINLPYIKKDNRKHLSMEKRAGQFAPFAALSGFDDEIKQIEKTTQNHFEYNKQLIDELNSKLIYLDKCISNKPLVEVRYFVNHMKKDGDKYHTSITTIKKVDKINKCLILSNNQNIMFEDIIELNSTIFNNNVIEDSI